MKVPAFNKAVSDFRAQLRHLSENPISYDALPDAYFQLADYATGVATQAVIVAQHARDKAGDYAELNSKYKIGAPDEN